MMKREKVRPTDSRKNKNPQQPRTEEMKEKKKERNKERKKEREKERASERRKGIYRLAI